MAALTSITRAVAEELCWAPVDPPATELRRAEVGTVLRLAGRFCGTPARPVLVAELDHAVVGVRLRDELAQLAGRSCAVGLNASGRGEGRMVVSSGVLTLTQQLGLLDAHGRLVRGLPPVTGGYLDHGVAAAVWRGAFLARGRLSDPGADPRVTVVCPAPEVARALVGAAGWLRVTAHRQPVGRPGAELVVVEGEADVTALLGALGAPATAAIWGRQHRTRAGQVPERPVSAARGRVPPPACRSDTSSPARRSDPTRSSGRPCGPSGPDSTSSR